MRSPDPEPVGPLNVRKIGYRVEVQLDDDGTPMVLGERLVEVRPGEWMTPLGAALSTAAFPDQWLDGTEHAEPIGGHTVVMDDLAAWLTQIWDEQERTARVEVEMAEEWFGGPEFSLTYQWARLTRHTSGGYGSSFMPGAPTPTEVLAQIAADRQILARCVDAQVAYASIRETSAGDSTSAKVERAGYGQTANALLDVVRLLALPHADRDGYREEWKP